MARIICWYSRGEASRQAAKIAIEENRASDNQMEVLVVRIHIDDEYNGDTEYDQESELYFGQKIVVIRDEKYGASVDEVIRKTRYMSGVRGARCTAELKKAVRRQFQNDDDIHVFGMTVEEAHRIDNILDAEPELDIWPVLIDAGLTKNDCFMLANIANLRPAYMYQLGYRNNNCVGCLKATGAGYWNKIRRDFPEVFAKRAEQERLLGVAMCKISEAKFKKKWPWYYAKMLDDHNAGLVGWSRDRKQLRIPLRYLPPDAGNHKDLDIGACGFYCEKPHEEE